MNSKRTTAPFQAGDDSGGSPELRLAEADLANAKKTVWRIELQHLKKPIFVDAYLVRHSSGVRLLFIDPSRLLMEVCCFAPGTNVSDKLTKILIRCPELEEFIWTFANNKRFITLRGAISLIKNCNAGKLGKAGYVEDMDPDERMERIDTLRDSVIAFLEEKERELATPSRVEFVSSHPLPEDATPQHADAAPQHAHDDPSAIVKFWDCLRQSQFNGTQHELAVEGYFHHPHIAAIYAQFNAREEVLRDDDLIETIDAYSEGRPPSGFVYAAWNPLFAGLIKIGATMRTPQIRLRELSGAGVPEPFELVASIPSTNPFKLEREIHKRFVDVRKYGCKKEFFTLTRDEVKDYFASVAEHGMSLPARKRKAAEV